MKGERDYVDKLFLSLSDAKKKRPTTIRSDHYPFDSKLSIMTLKGRRDISMYDLRKYNEKNIIINVFRENRSPVRFIAVGKSYSYDMYVFDPIASDAILSDNKVMEIA